jgi:hypothetical protein
MNPNKCGTLSKPLNTHLEANSQNLGEQLPAQGSLKHATILFFPKINQSSLSQ